MKLRICVHYLCLIATAWLASGCAAVLIGGGVAAGVGTAVYVRGELKSTESVPLDGAWAASLKALGELKLPVVTKQKDGLSGNIAARTAADKRVQLQLKKVSDKTTEIRIRVGTFGDESQSRLILDQLKKHF